MQAFQSTFKLAKVPATPEEVFVTFELRNTHPTQTYYVCHYHTPLESLKSSRAVEVTNVKTRTVLPYRGFMCKRLAPQPDNYLQIAPGSTIVNTLNIAGGFHFGKGHYSLTIGSACTQLSQRSE